jgi:hypothetical protein
VAIVGLLSALAGAFSLSAAETAEQIVAGAKKEGDEGNREGRKKNVGAGFQTRPYFA